MISRSYFKKDQLEIQNVQLYLEPIQNLSFFVQNVTFPTNLLAEHKYKECKNGLIGAAKKHAHKLILPWKRLIQRMNNQNIGLTQIHVGFLNAIVFFKLYKTGLSVIQQPVLPKIIEPQRYMQYLSYCAQIYANLHRFKEAYSCANKAIQIQCQKPTLCLQVLKKHIFLSKVVGRQYSKIQFMTYLQKLKLNIGHQFKETFANAQELLQAFLQFIQKKQLSQKSQKILQQEDLYWVTKIKVKTELGKYIQNLGQNNYRMKASQIKNQPILTFQNIRDINRFQHIYKYDVKNGIMYFNNKVTDQHKIDKMISQSCSMHKQITNNQKQTKLGRQKSGGMRGMMGMMM